jgi:hypothetical protein
MQKVVKKKFIFRYTIISDAKAAVDVYKRGGKGNIP